MKCCFVIPVYNHAMTLTEVIHGCLDTGLPVIVVDDGSSDDISAVLKKFPGIITVKHKTNFGKGQAIISGLKAAQGIADFAITIDADGQHNPADALNLIDSIKEGTKPIVIGARKNMLDDAAIPWSSRFGRKFSNFWVRLSGGPELTDTQSGFRVYPIKEMLDLRIISKRFQFEVEALVLAKLHGIPVYEVPVGVFYPEKRISHFRPFVDFMRNSLTFTRLIAMRILLPGFIRRRLTSI